MSNSVLNQGDLKETLDFFRVCKGQHSICLLKAAEIKRELINEPSYLALFQELAVKWANGFTFSNRIELVKSAPEEGQICIEELYATLSKPAVLVLENEHSDLNFILTVLTSLNSKRLLSTINKYWEVRGGGGSGEIIKCLNKSAERLRSASRVSVVNDSDKLYSAANLPTTQVKIINHCRKLSVSHVTLKKREIENYIVDEVLSAIENIDRDLKTVYLTLKPNQKDHYDLKKGVDEAKKGNYGGLFDQFSSVTLSNLSQGFGNDIAEKAFSLEHRELFTITNINKRCKNILPEFRQIELNIKNIL
ncbi:MAG: hypothetical protein WBC43_05470 [Olleya sp.]